MRTFRGFFALLLLTAIAGAAHAHGEGAHLMGTVKTVAAKSMTVTATDGDEVVVAVDDKTKIESAGKPATMADVKPGARVVVHTKKSGDTVVATLIKIAGAGATGQEHSHEHQAK